MESSKWKGAITVYLSIILSAVILLGGVLIDLVRIRAAEIQVRRAANTAALSVLAGFQPELKEGYGLFALHNSSTAYLNSELEKYLRANLSGLQGEKHSGLYLEGGFRKASFVDFYDYRLEGAAVTPLYNFTENEITRQQIIEYMKYRAPVQLMESISQKLEAAAETASLGDQYEKKTEIEKKLKKVDTSLRWLQTYIDQLNAFKKEYFYSIQSSNTTLKSYCRSLLSEQIYSKCEGIDFDSYANAENQEELAAIEEQLAEAYSYISAAVEAQAELLGDQLDKAAHAAEKALQEVKRIGELSKEARQAMEELQGLLEEQGGKAGSAGTPKGFDTAIRQDLEKYEALLDSESSESLLTQLQWNQEVLQAMGQSLEALPSLVSQVTAGIQSAAVQQVEAGLREGFYKGIGEPHGEAIYKLREFQALEELARSYKQLPDIAENIKKNEGKDVRKSVAKAAKEVLSLAEEKDNKKIEKPELLPSYFDGGKYPNKLLSAPPSAPSAAMEETLVPEADFDEDSDFVGQGFRYISNLGALLKNSVAGLGEELYVNEYILKVFKDEVEIKESNTEGKKGSTYFNKAEVEYIINGHSSEGVNKLFVKGRILLIRFAVDTFYVYSNPEKRAQALQLATAAAGITGFGIPIVHNLIMCAWGTMEGISDVNELYDGKSVPFMKDENSWKTDLVPSGFQVNQKGQRSGNVMDFNYHDYLRLLLLIENKDIKISHIEDLLQLNVSKDKEAFLLKNSNTFIKAEVQVSIKYWFLTKLFVPNRYKTEDGQRHKIEIEVWKGY